MTVRIVSSSIYILVLLIILFVVYRLIYSYQVNKALKTGKHVNTITPISMLLSVIILFLVFINIAIFSQLDFVSSQLNQVENDNVVLSNRLDRIYEDLSLQIDQTSKNTYDYSLEYNGIDGELTVFELSFKIKSLDTGSTITIISEDLNGDTEEYDVTNDNMIYQTTLKLDFEDKYIIYVKIVSPQSTFIEIINTWAPQEVLEARFELYPMTVRFNSNDFELKFFNALSLLENQLEGIDVDYIEIQYFDNSNGNEGRLRSDDFVVDEQGSNYLGESEYITAVFEAEHSFNKDTSLTVYVIIFDKDGHYYTFSIEPQYTSSTLD